MEDWFNKDGRAALAWFRKAEGLNQTELASHLQITQPHLSKLMAGKRKPSPALERRIRTYLTKMPNKSFGDTSEWTSRALELASASPEFRALLRAAIKLVQA